MEKIIAEVLSGKKGSATIFYKQYAPKIRRYLQAKLPEGEAEEILQDTFLSAFDSLALYRGDSSVLTWLISIARHEVADFYRKRYVRVVVEKTAPLFDNMVSDILSPEFEWEKKKVEKRFFSSYHSLSKQYQDVLSYKYELSMSVKEIAERMEMSFEATESLLFRARLAFREEYETERDFLKELEEKSKEQQRLAKTELISGWAKGIGDWLVVNPWRVLVPIAAIIYLILRILLGGGYREFVLGLFGGFVR